jgi:hypothetical protein
VHGALPRRPALHLLTLPVDGVPVEFTTTSVNIHLWGSEPPLLLPEITADPESQHDEESQVGLKELGDGTSLLTRLKTKGRDSSVELEKSVSDTRPVNYEDKISLPEQ